MQSHVVVNQKITLKNSLRLAMSLYWCKQQCAVLSHFSSRFRNALKSLSDRLCLELARIEFHLSFLNEFNEKLLYLKMGLFEINCVVLCIIFYIPYCIDYPYPRGQITDQRTLSTHLREVKLGVDFKNKSKTGFKLNIRRCTINKDTR